MNLVWLGASKHRPHSAGNKAGFLLFESIACQLNRNLGNKMKNAFRCQVNVHMALPSDAPLWFCSSQTNCRTVGACLISIPFPFGNQGDAPADAAPGAGDLRPPN